MDKYFINLLKCPFCGGIFLIDSIYNEAKSDVICGIIKCKCNEFPIIGGILYLKFNSLTPILLSLIKKGKSSDALLLLLRMNFDEVWAVLEFISNASHGTLINDFLIRSLVIWSKISRRYYLNNTLPLVKHLSTDSKSFYFKYRFSAESLWSLYPFIPLIRKKSRLILDLCCGMGHASFILSRYIDAENFVCADHTFKNLYLAKNYFIKGAQFLCLDGNYSLPFKDDVFESVFMLDSLHYIKSRYRLATELKRVSDPQGLILLLHLHNSLSHNIGAGYPLSPREWSNLFESNDLIIRVIPEDLLIESFLSDDQIDFNQSYSESSLDSANAISLIAIRDQSLFDLKYKFEPNRLSGSCSLILNPLYKLSVNNGKIFLVKETLNDFTKEYKISNKFLPNTYEIDDNIGKLLGGGALSISLGELDSSQLEVSNDLVSKFILLVVPKNYM